MIDFLPRSEELQRQNPNMHLLEGQLALYAAAGRASDLARALQMRELFSRSLFVHALDALPEVHGRGWRPLDAATSWFEPGHHFEWAWLLRQLGAVAAVDVEADVRRFSSAPWLRASTAKASR